MKHFGDTLGRDLKALQPMLQRFSVVQSQVLDIQHGEIQGLEHSQSLAKCGRVCAREDSLPRPGAERAWVVAADEVEKPTSGIAERAMNYGCQLRVMVQPDVLEHANRDEGFKTSRYVSIVVLDELYLVAQSFLAGPLAGKQDLLSRNIKGFDRHPIVPGHVKS